MHRRVGVALAAVPAAVGLIGGRVVGSASLGWLLGLYPGGARIIHETLNTDDLHRGWLSRHAVH